MAHLAINGGPAVRTGPFPGWPVYSDEDAKAVGDVILSGAWGSTKGRCVETFQAEFAAYQNAGHGICVSSGTTALALALQAVDINPGDEVIVPAYTFIATATAVLMVNAVPVFVDIDPETYTLDPDGVEAAITPRTRAILPVHFAGMPAHFDRLTDIARRRGLRIVEDAAQAHGAQWKGKGVGAIGDIGAFSFQASKNLNAGEGGIMVTDDDDLAAVARSLANCGRSDDGVWYGHYRLAGNNRMTELQGALLRAQMSRLEEQTARRNDSGDYLTSRLSDIDGVAPTLRSEQVTRHGYHLYVFRYKSEAFGGASKERFVEALRAEGIPASPGYSIPLYKQPVFTERNFGAYDHAALRDTDYAALRLPETERACSDEAVWFTQNVLLGSREDMDDIVRAIAKIRERKGELTKT